MHPHQLARLWNGAMSWDISTYWQVREWVELSYTSWRLHLIAPGAWGLQAHSSPWNASIKRFLIINSLLSMFGSINTKCSHVGHPAFVAVVLLAWEMTKLATMCTRTSYSCSTGLVSAVLMSCILYGCLESCEQKTMCRFDRGSLKLDWVLAVKVAGCTVSCASAFFIPQLFTQSFTGVRSGTHFNSKLLEMSAGDKWFNTDRTRILLHVIIITQKVTTSPRWLDPLLPDHHLQIPTGEYTVSKYVSQPTSRCAGRCRIPCLDKLIQCYQLIRCE